MQKFLDFSLFPPRKRRCTKGLRHPLQEILYKQGTQYRQTNIFFGFYRVAALLFSFCFDLREMEGEDMERRRKEKEKEKNKIELFRL